MTNFHLAQLNIAKAKYDLDDKAMIGFTSRIDQINALAENSPGFIWRLKDESGDATAINAFDDPRLIVNMSVWENQTYLSDYVYRSAHNKVMAKRKTWFDWMEEAYHVLWWIDAGTVPTIEDGKVRLQSLRDNGPTTFAFNFKNTFQPSVAA